MKINLYITFVLLLCVACSQAQSSLEPSYRHISVEDGLLSSAVYNVFQDSRKYMWFLTSAGVVRYDGHEISKPVSLDSNDTYSVFRMMEDDRGRLWYTTFGRGIFYVENDTIHPYKYNDQLLSTVHKGAVMYEFQMDENNQLTVCFESDGKVQIDAEGNISSYPEETQYTFFFEQEDDHVLTYRRLANHDKQNMHEIMEMDVNGASFDISTTDQHTYTGYRYALATKSGHLIVSTVFKLFVFDGQELIYEESLEKDVITMREDEDGRLWLGFRNEGAECRGTWEEGYSLHDRFLLGHSVTGMVFDDDGGTWFSTLDNGVYYAPNLEFKSLRFDGNYTAPFPAAVGHDSSIWVGDRNGKIFKIDSDFNVKPFYQNKSKFANILDLACTSDNLWVASSRLSAFSLPQDPKGAPSPTSSDYSVTTLYADTSGNVILGMNNGFSPRVVNGKPDLRRQILSERVTKITSLDSTNFLIAGINGLTTWNSERNELSNFYREDIEIQGRITDIDKAAGSRLLVSTDNGLYWVSPTEIERVIPGVDYSVYTTVRDGDDLFWCGTNKGILQLRKEGANWINEFYDSSDGLNCNEVYGLVKRGEQMLAATQKGLVVFDVESLTPNEGCTDVQIEQISVNDQAADWSNGLEVSPDFGIIEVTFTAHCYSALDNTPYFFRLHQEDQWQSTRGPTIRFMSLKPDDYHLQLTTKNGMLLSIPPVSVNFKVLPYWYQNIFIWLSVAVLAMIIGWMLFREQQEKAKMSEDLLQNRLNALGAQMNPHFLFNSLNSVQNFIFKNDKKSAAKYLSKFAQLMRRTLDQTRQEHLSLADEIETLGLLADLENQRFKSEFNFQINCDANIPQNSTFIPAMLIQPHLENAIWHGIRTLEEDGEIIIDFKRISASTIQATVTDNGVGRQKSSKKERTPGHKSSGIQVTEERLSLLCKKHGVKHLFRIEDLYNADSPAGTKITFHIPIENYE